MYFLIFRNNIAVIFIDSKVLFLSLLFVFIIVYILVLFLSFSVSSSATAHQIHACNSHYFLDLITTYFLDLIPLFGLAANLLFVFFSNAGGLQNPVDGCATSASLGYQGRIKLVYTPHEGVAVYDAEQQGLQVQEAPLYCRCGCSSREQAQETEEESGGCQQGGGVQSQHCCGAHQIPPVASAHQPQVELGAHQPQGHQPQGVHVARAKQHHHQYPSEVERRKVHRWRFCHHRGGSVYFLCKG